MGITNVMYILSCNSYCAAFYSDNVIYMAKGEVRHKKEAKKPKKEKLKDGI
jgi:hypothetical protein